MTLQLSGGALALAGLLVVAVVLLAVVAAFLGGMALQQRSAAAPAVTVIQLPPTSQALAAAPATAAPAAPAPYPAPAAPAPADAAAPPVFAPVRPTSAAQEPPAPVAPTATAAPDFQLAPAGAQPAATLPPAPVAPAVVGAAPAAPVVAAAPAAPAPAAPPLPTDEPPAPTAAPPRSAASSRSSGDVPGASQPAARPAAHTIKGNVTWTADKGPVVLKGDVNVERGAALIVGEGVTIVVPRGASIVVSGSFYVLGSAARPVRITQAGGDRSQRWEAIYARPGSSLALNNVEVSGGGAGGTLIGAELSDVKIRGARLVANGGQVRLLDSRVEIRDTLMTDNELPYGAAVDATFTRGGAFTLTGSRIVRNALSPGTAPVLVTNQSFSAPATLEITGNLLVGQDGPNLQLFTNAQLQGNVTCNTLTGGANGVSVRSDGPPTLSPMLNLRDNAIEGHTPPIIPIYLEYGIGRGATSDLPLGMANNWWETPSGPFDPKRNNDGRGEAVGELVTFGPWLTQRPSCAPSL